MLKKEKNENGITVISGQLIVQTDKDNVVGLHIPSNQPTLIKPGTRIMVKGGNNVVGTKISN